MFIGEVPAVHSDGSVPGVPGITITEQGIEGINHKKVAQHMPLADVDAYWLHPKLLGGVETRQFLEGPDATDDTVPVTTNETLWSSTGRDVLAIAEMQAWLYGRVTPHAFEQL